MLKAKRILVLGVAVLLSSSAAYGNGNQTIPPTDILQEALGWTKTLRGGLLLKILPEISLAQAQAGDQNAARKTLERTINLIKTTAQDSRIVEEVVTALTSVAVIQGKIGLPKEMGETFDEARRRANMISDIRSKIISFQEIANAQVRADELTDAQQTVERLLDIKENSTAQGSATPDYLSYLKIRSVMNIAEESRRVHKQELTETLLQKVIHMFKTSPYTVDPNSPYVEDLLEGLATMQVKMGELKSAESTLQDFYRRTQDRSRKIEATLKISQALLEANEKRLVEKYLQTAIEMTQELAFEDGQLQSFVSSKFWKRIAIVKARLGDINGALDADAKISIDSERGDETAYQIIAKLHSLDLKGTARIVKDWTKARPDLQLLSDLVIAQSRAGNTSEAIATFDVLANKVQSFEGLEQHKKQFTTNEQPLIFLKAIRAVAATRATRGDVAGSLLWARERRLPDEKVYALLGVAEGIVAH